MAAQIYTFKITYADCDNRIWRVAAVSSNYTLAQLGYMVLATFDTMAYHLFEMEYKDTKYVLTEEELFYRAKGKKNDILRHHKVGELGMQIGDRIEMTYDLGCCQVFDIELLEIGDMPKGRGRAYPKILDGAGFGIVDDMPADELLKVIQRTELEGHSGIYYSSSGIGIRISEWDHRRYSLDLDNALLKCDIMGIRDGYESLEE